MEESLPFLDENDTESGLESASPHWKGREKNFHLGYGSYNFAKRSCKRILNSKKANHRKGYNNQTSEVQDHITS